ncbi:hypothetical protein BZG36_03012 [Bifiguratus adelaidae]|uniref:Oxidase FUB9 n=1 Tax=Bifiguratus adelaidae TaxID=1938954 RepID=A0A261XZP0_9FUNG|nr:hypothetical protein BZG36_03012 [Bifiguratus adelaidae]
MVSGAPVCLDDFEKHAQATLPKMVWDYYKSGAMDEQTVNDNKQAYSRWRIRPRVLVDVSNVRTETKLFGDRISTPICIAAAAMQRMAHPDGELATSRAAAKFGTAMCLSTYSTTCIEDVIAEGKGAIPYGFQLYVYKDRQVSESLVRRAEKAGYKALYVTVDTPLLGRRLADERNVFELPKHLRLANFDATPSLTVSSLLDRRGHLPGQNDLPITPTEDDPAMMNIVLSATTDTSLNFEDLKWLRRITKMKIILKGVMTAEDTELAVAAGVDGIVVSNHGGRQLDGVLATIDALPEVVAAAKGRIDVFLDGGIRKGTDVFKALCLGAKAVYIGRPMLYGLAYAGEEGVLKVLELLNDELKLAMALAGVDSIDRLGPQYLIHETEETFLSQGFLVLPNFLSRAEVADYLAHARWLADNVNIEGHPALEKTLDHNGQVSADCLKSQKQLASDGQKEHETRHGSLIGQYFLDSATDIRAFFEKGAVNKQKKLVVKKARAIHKIGHALHYKDPMFAKLTYKPAIVEIAKSLGYRRPALLQSMIVCKQPHIGGKIPVHQDSTFVFTDPPSALGFWIPLEDCTEENGCLQFASGSHINTPVTSRFVRSLKEGEEGITKFISIDPAWSREYGPPDKDIESSAIDPRKKGSKYRARPHQDTIDTTSSSKPVYAKQYTKAGSLVLIHGNTVHTSSANLSKKSRFAYTFHVVETSLKSNVRYPPDNWCQPEPGRELEVLYDLDLE